MELPPELQAAVERLRAGQGTGGLKTEAAALSRHFRGGGTSDASISLPAYLAVRLAATYAAVAAVLVEVKRLRPEFAPASLIDAGSGPGTASWAATMVWPGLAHVVLLDRNREFLDLAGTLASRSGHPALAAADRQHRDMAQVEAVGPASLVIAAYALAEIHDSAQDAAVMALWRAAQNMLVLVEPGTPAGFARLRNARGRLLEAGAVQVAPCPHARACPLTGEDWCHFSVRLPRRRLHMHAKQARVPFEDERYAYLAVSRDGRVSGEPRILAPPKDAKPGLTFKLCTAEGLETRHVARRDAATYKLARKRKWGDVL